MRVKYYGKRCQRNGTFVVLGWYWYRGGGPTYRYGDGSRFWYFYAGPVILGWEFVWWVDLRKPMPKAEGI